MCLKLSLETGGNVVVKGCAYCYMQQVNNSVVSHY